jgi:hypothetical protein
MELVVVAGMILDGKVQMTPTNDIPRIAEGGTNVQNLGYTLTKRQKYRKEHGLTIYQRDKKIEEYKYSKGRFV